MFWFLLCLAEPLKVYINKKVYLCWVYSRWLTYLSAKLCYLYVPGLFKLIFSYISVTKCVGHSRLYVWNLKTHAIPLKSKLQHVPVSPLVQLQYRSVETDYIYPCSTQGKHATTSILQLVRWITEEPLEPKSLNLAGRLFKNSRWPIMILRS